MQVEADPDQLEQLLINIVRNAVDATLETGGKVWIDWTTVDGFLQLTVEDEGPGLPDTSNLFVPFFTTKPQGSGHRSGAEPPDRRSARRHARPRESHRRQGLPRDAAAAVVGRVFRPAIAGARQDAPYFRGETSGPGGTSLTVSFLAVPGRAVMYFPDDRTI